MEKIISDHPFLLTAILVLAIFDLILKLIALWKAAKRNQKTWFVSLGIVNSFGIFPLVYLFLHRHKKS